MEEKDKIKLEILEHDIDPIFKIETGIYKLVEPNGKTYFVIQTKDDIRVVYHSFPSCTTLLPIRDEAVSLIQRLVKEKLQENNLGDEIKND